MTVACGKENLLELREAHPHLFYSGQTWFVREAFMRILPSDPLPIRPSRVVRLGQIPASSSGLPRAVDLAHLYVEHPDDMLWEKYLWCSDTDSDGQRVYVGGVNPRQMGQSGGFQIHRHLAINMQWGQASWG